MKAEDLEVKFEPFELPEDYKFLYKIKGCEHKLDFDTNTIVDKILSTRTKKVDEEVIRQLRNIGEERGINELILIDESKVLNLIKAVRALETIKDLCNLKVYKNKLGQCFLEGTNILFPISKEEYDLLKKVLNYGN